MRAGRLAILVGLLPVLLFVARFQAELQGLRADVGMIAVHPSHSMAWRRLGAADFEDFMAFCRRHIPPSAAVVSIASMPAFGYYRGSYDLYPRTVWPIVSPLGLHAQDYPRVSARLLAATLARTGARYVAVWRVTLPPPGRAYRSVARFAANEYVLAVR